jgi:hypothetical protein
VPGVPVPVQPARMAQVNVAQVNVRSNAWRRTLPILLGTVQLVTGLPDGSGLEDLVSLRGSGDE